MFQGKDKWPNLCAAVGAVFFFSSDSMIGIDSFYSNLPHAHVSLMSLKFQNWLFKLNILLLQTMVMVTYYVAQLGIALGAMLQS